jgi:tetratricopeptide (TPR) repeat protein
MDVAKSKPSRLECWCRILAVLAATWAIAVAVSMYRRPPALAVARQAVAEGHWNTALDCYLLHLVDHPADWKVRLELGVFLTGIAHEQARIELEKIPPEADEFVAANREIAKICLLGKRFSAAKKALLTLESATPDDWWVHLSLAEVLARQDEFALGLRHARRSAELNATHVRTYLLMAELFDKLNRQIEMIPPLLTAIDLQPEYYPAHLNLCYAYSTAAQASNARREADWCLARNPADLDARRLLAAAARDEGNRDEAMEHIRKALELAPDDLDCRLLEAELLLFERQAEKALGRLQPLYKQHRNDRRLVALLAQAATAAGQLEQAEEYRQQGQHLRNH